MYSAVKKQCTSRTPGHIVTIHLQPRIVTNQIVHLAQNLQRRWLVSTRAYQPTINIFLRQQISISRVYRPNEQAT